MIKYLILLLLTLFACQSSPHGNEWMEKNGKVKVLSTTAMIDDMVGQVGKERIDHSALMVGEVDPHSYELVKGDDEKLSYAQVVFSNGVGLEHGASLRVRLQKHPHSVAIGDAIQKSAPEKLLYIDGQLDPHIWMDISLFAEGIDAIVEALTLEDPSGADYYRQNGEELRSKMLATHQDIVNLFAAVPNEKRYLVTSHNAFNYFTRAYLSFGIWEEERCAAPEGLAPDGQLSSTDIQRIIDHLCTYHIPVVFSESNVSRDSLKKIVSCCKEKGLAVHICSKPLYGDSMGEHVKSYLEMIRHNAEVMKNEWESR